VAYLQRTFGNRAVQRVCAPPAPDAAPDLGERIRSAGGGRPLEGNVQRALEEHLGADLSGVRLHVDSTAGRIHSCGLAAARLESPRSGVFASVGDLEVGEQQSVENDQVSRSDTHRRR
jgi:hypothetical protein